MFVPRRGRRLRPRVTPFRFWVCVGHSRGGSVELPQPLEITSEHTPRSGERIAGPFPAETRRCVPATSRATISLHADCRAGQFQREARRPTSEAVSQDRARTVPDRRRRRAALRRETGVFGVIGKHAVPKEELIAVDVRKQRIARRGERFSHGKPSASPTAMPSIHPVIASRSSMEAIVAGSSVRWGWGGCYRGSGRYGNRLPKRRAVRGLATSARRW